MFHKARVLFAVLTVFHAIGATSSVAALGPVGTSTSSIHMESHFQPVSFWGRPFPYGYTAWGPCIRYEPVETTWGTRWQRVSICGYRHHRHY